MNKLKDLLRTRMDVIAYLFFGVCTTCVNVASYWIFAEYFGVGVMASSCIAWFLAVLFAYVTNRLWVFHSTVHGFYSVLREMTNFFSCRLATGALDIACMYVFVVLLGFNGAIIKLFDDIVIIVLNYLASKFIVFRSKKQPSN